MTITSQRALNKLQYAFWNERNGFKWPLILNDTKMRIYHFKTIYHFYTFLKIKNSHQKATTMSNEIFTWGSDVKWSVESIYIIRKGNHAHQNSLNLEYSFMILVFLLYCSKSIKFKYLVQVIDFLKYDDYITKGIE